MTNGAVMKYAGVPFFLAHLGMADTPLANLISAHPCAKYIDASTGVALPADARNRAMCGAQILCTNCAHCINVLGGAWHIPSAADCLYKVVEQGFAWWIERRPCTWRMSQVPEHICSSQCPLSGQFAPKAQGTA